MRKSKYNSFDELPLMLTVEDVSHVLGIGLAHAARRDSPEWLSPAFLCTLPGSWQTHFSGWPGR